MNLASLFLALLAFFTTVPAPCIEDGACADVEIEAPSLEADGMPVDAEYVGSVPAAVYEQDAVFDDAVGSSKVSVRGKSNASTSVNVCNVDGTLTAGSETGDGGGDCLELYAVFEYRYPVTVTHTIEVKAEPWGLGGSSTTTVTTVQWVQKTIHSRVIEVCPC